MNRYFHNKNRKRHSSKRTNFFAILTLLVVLSGILLFYSNEQQKEQILTSYCGDFGFNGKSLVLMKDSTFRFSYYGCAQTNGYVKGTWNSDGAILTFEPEKQDDNLGFKYQVRNTELIPFNKSSYGKFTLCKHYRNQWERNDIDEKYK
jgi:hypothetical protein